MFSYEDGVFDSIRASLDKALIDSQRADGVFALNSDTLEKLANSVRQAVNFSDGGKTHDYIVNKNYEIDYENLTENADFLLKSQVNIDLLLGILKNARISKFEQKSAESIFLKLFNGVKSDSEKKMIAVMANEKLSRDSEVLKEFREFYDIPAGTLNLAKKQTNANAKTNYFFVDDDRVRVKDNNHLMNKILNPAGIAPTSPLGILIISLFKTKKEELEGENYLLQAQLKKVKIYLLFKLVSSYKYSKLSTEKKQEYIENILSKDINSYDEDLVNIFAKSCDFDSSLYISDDDEKIEDICNFNEKDIIQTLGGNGEVIRGEIDNLFRYIPDSDSIEFFDLKNKTGTNSEFFYAKIIPQEGGKKKLLLCYDPSQRDRLIAAIFRNKYVCDKISTSKNVKADPEIFSFAKIVAEVAEDPMPVSGYDEVYGKFLLHEEDRGLGGIRNDKTFTTKEDSNENFIRNDYSKYVVPTSALLTWLKLQAISGNAVRDITVAVSDIENLPKILEEYYKFIYDRKILCKQQLTPVRNLIVKGTKILSDEKKATLVQELNNCKTCFLSLNIDDIELHDYVESLPYDERVCNNHVLIGANGNFYSEENVIKRKNQSLKNVFNFDGVQQHSANYVKYNVPNISQLSMSNLKIGLDKEKNIKSLKEKIKKNTSKGPSAGGANVEATTDMDVDTDFDLENVQDFKKPAKTVDDLNEGDIITLPNCYEKLMSFAKSNNNRLSPQQKEFLLKVIENIGGKEAVQELFRILSNRQSKMTSLEPLMGQYKGVNTAFTLECFLHLLFNTIKFNCPRFNGLYGDPEISVYKVKTKNGSYIFISAKTLEGTKKTIFIPVETMFCSMPLDSLETDVRKISAKVDVNKINQSMNEITSRLSTPDSSYLLKVFYENPKKVSMEYLNYISENKKEILGYLDKFASKNPMYKALCNSVCRNFCKPIKAGNLKLNFSLIDPVSFLKGMNEVIDLLERLKKEQFIDDNFINAFCVAIGNCNNKYAIQNAYFLLIQRKFKVEKAIVEFRNTQGENTGVDVNDLKELAKYFKKNPIRSDTERQFSVSDFFSVAKVTDPANGSNRSDYGNDIFVMDDFFDSSSFILNRNLLLRVNQAFSFDQEKGGTVSSISFRPRFEDDNYDCWCADALTLMMMMSKKYNRLSDGTPDEPGLSSAEKKVIQNKVILINFINQAVTTSEADIDTNLDKKKAYILTYALKNMIDSKDASVSIPKIIENINSLSDGEVDNLYSLVKEGKESALLYLNIFATHDTVNNKFLNLCSYIEKGNDDLSVKYQTKEDRTKIKKYYEMVYKFLNETKEGKKKLLDNEIKDPELIKFALFNKERNEKSWLFEEILLDVCQKLRDNNFIGSDNELLEKSVNVLNSDVFFSFYYKTFADSVDNSTKSYLNVIRNSLLKYCFATNNYGKYSVLSDSEKEFLYSKDPERLEQDYQRFVAYNNIISVGEKQSFLEHLNLCAENGILFSNVLSYLPKDIKDIDPGNQYDNLNKMIAIQKICLAGKHISKSLNIRDVSDIYDQLKKYGVRIHNDVVNKGFPAINNGLGSISLEYCFSTEFNASLNLIVDYLGTELLDFNQKKNYLSRFLNGNKVDRDLLKVFNRTVLMFDKYLNENEKESIKISKDFCQKLLGKVLIRMNNKTTVDGLLIAEDKLKFILEKMEQIKAAYYDSIAKNDKMKRSRMLNLSGRITLAINDMNIDQLELLLSQISFKSLSDSDILNKFDYLKEHILRGEDVSYDDVTRLYNSAPEEKFLNSGYTHGDLCSMVAYNTNLKKQREEVDNELRTLGANIITKAYDSIADNGGTVVDNKMMKKTTKDIGKIISVADKTLEKNSGFHAKLSKLLQKLRKDYSNPWTISQTTLSKTGGVRLLDSILKEGNTGGCVDKQFRIDDVEKMKQLVEYVNSTIQIFMLDRNFTRNKIDELITKVRKHELLTIHEELELLSAFATSAVFEINKSFLVPQIAAAVCSMYTAGVMHDVDDEALQLGRRTAVRLGTGVGKTLTTVLTAFAMSIHNNPVEEDAKENDKNVKKKNGKKAKKKNGEDDKKDIKYKTYIPCVSTFNQLLVNEMMAEFEKFSIFKGHLFYINEKQEIVDKATNTVLTFDEVLERFDGSTGNILFGTNAGFVFWFKKLLLEGGEKGYRIAMNMARSGAIIIDEFDSEMNPKTSNKMSVMGSGKVGMANLKKMIATDNLYNFCKRYNIDFSIDKPNIPVDLPKRDVVIAEWNKLINDIKDSFIGPDNADAILFDPDGNYLSKNKISLEKEEEIYKFFLACSDVKLFEMNKHYIVDTDIKTGYNKYYPVMDGVPAKNGSKFDALRDLALKVHLKQQYGYNFSDLTRVTYVISEASSWNLTNSFAYSKQESGTVPPKSDISMGPDGKEVVNFQATYPKLLDTRYQPVSITKKGYKNPVLDAVFLVHAIKSNFRSGNHDDYTKIKQTILKVLEKSIQRGDYTEEEINECKVKDKLDEIISGILDKSYPNDYHLAIMQNTNEIEAFSRRLNNNLNDFNTIFSTEIELGRILSLPKILLLDKSTHLIDDTELKSILSEAKANKQEVFAYGLPDRARGFDFSKSPNVIGTSVTTEELNAQIIGRTGRNDRMGYVSFAYAFSEEDCKKYGIGPDDLTHEKVKEVMAKKSLESAREFFCKNHYFLLIEQISKKMSLFAGILMNPCDEKIKEEMRDPIYEVMAVFIGKVKEGFDSLYSEYSKKYLEKGDFNKEEWERIYLKFENDALDDLYNVVYPFILSMCFRPEDQPALTLQSLIKMVDEKYKMITVINKNTKAENNKDFKPTNVTAEERNRLVNETIFETGTNIILEDENGEYKNVDKLRVRSKGQTQEEKEIELKKCYNICNLIGSLNGCDFSNAKSFDNCGFSESSRISSSLSGSNGTFKIKGDIIVASKDILNTSDINNPVMDKRQIAVINATYPFLERDASGNVKDENYKKVLNTLTSDAIVAFITKAGIPVFMTRDEALNEEDVKRVVEKAKRDYTDIAESFADKINFGNNFDNPGEDEIKFLRNCCSLAVKHIYTYGTVPRKADLVSSLEKRFKLSLSGVFKKAGSGDEQYPKKATEEEREKNRKFTEEVFKEQNSEIMANVKNSFRFAAREGILLNCILGAGEDNNASVKKTVRNVIDAADALDDEKIAKKIEIYQKRLDDIKNFNFDFNKEELYDINNRDEKEREFLSDLIIDKYQHLSSLIETLKEDLEDDCCLDNSVKEEFLEECNECLEPESILKTAKKVMNIVSSLSRLENVSFAGEKNKHIDNINLTQTTKNFANDDTWKDSISLENIDEVDAKLVEIKQNREKATTISDTIVNDCDEEKEDNLRKILSDSSNNTLENIETMDKNVEELKKIRDKTDLLVARSNNASFKSFKMKDFYGIIEELDIARKSYTDILNEIKKSTNLSEKQKSECIDALHKKSVEAAVNLLFSPLGITKLINEFTVVNDGIGNSEKDSLFGVTDTTEGERELFDDIVNLYRSFFGEIKNTNGKENIIEVTEEDFEDQETDDDNEEEGKKKSKMATYIQQFGSYSGAVRDLLLSPKGRGILAPETNPQENKEVFPVRVFDFFKKTLTVLHKNYEKNSANHTKISNEIVDAIERIATTFKDNKKGLHKNVQSDLFKIYKKYLSKKDEQGEDLKSDISEENILKDESIEKIRKSLKDTSLVDLKKIKANLDTTVDNFVTEVNERTQRLERKHNVPPIFLKVIVAVITLCLVFLIKEGRELMFSSDADKNENGICDKQRNSTISNNLAYGSSNQKKVLLSKGTKNVSLPEVKTTTESPKQINNNGNVVNNLTSTRTGLGETVK